jgi:hypothetical protein
MPTVNLSSFAGVGAQFFNDSGVPLAGGLIYSYAAGTTTPKTTYTSSAGNIAHTNPIILNSAGRVPGGEIWITSGAYKFVLATSANVTIATYDNVTSIVGESNLVANFTGTGVQTTFTLPASPVSENNTQVYINGVYQNKDTYTVTNTSVIFSEAPPVNSKIEVVYN